MVSTGPCADVSTSRGMLWEAASGACQAGFWEARGPTSSELDYCTDTWNYLGGSWEALPNALRFCCRGVRRSRASQSRIYPRGCAAHTPRSAASAG